MRSALSNARVIASLTLKRLLRGRAVWISVIIAALPIAFTAVLRTQKTTRHMEDDVLVFVTLLLAILPAMFVSSSIGEDIEDRTSTYLWSRPVPRWSVIAGKLLALGPLAAALVVGSWFVAVFIGNGEPPTLQSVVGVGAGTLVVCCACAAIATLVPKHGMPLAIAYMLFFDIPVGAMPISLAELSISHQLRALSGAVPELQMDPGGGAIGLAMLAVVWLAIAIWRIRRLEA